MRYHSAPKNCSAAQKWQHDLRGDWSTISLASRKMLKYHRKMSQSVWEIMQKIFEVDLFPKWRISLVVSKLCRHDILIFKRSLYGTWLSQYLCAFRWGLTLSYPWYQLMNRSLYRSGSLKIGNCVSTAPRIICYREGQIITPSIIDDNTFAAPVYAICSLLGVTE